MKLNLINLFLFDSLFYHYFCIMMHINKVQTGEYDQDSTNALKKRIYAKNQYLNPDDPLSKKKRGSEQLNLQSFYQKDNM